MTYFSRLCLLAFLLLIGSVAGSAVQAQIVPNAQVASTVFFNLGGRDDSNTFGTLTRSDSRFGNLEATVFGAPSPVLSARSRIGPNAQISHLFGTSSVLVDYFFKIVGPAGILPVGVSAAGQATGRAGEGASFALIAGWNLLDPGTPAPLAGFRIQSGQLTGAFEQSFVSHEEVLLSANRVYRISLIAKADAAATAVGSESFAQAFVDPVLSFGPGVDPLAYSFVFSNGIGNVASTVAPEPATLSLIGMGLLLPVAGAVIRRRRQRKA